MFEYAEMGSGRTPPTLASVAGITHVHHHVNLQLDFFFLLFRCWLLKTIFSVQNVPVSSTQFSGFGKHLQITQTILESRSPASLQTAPSSLPAQAVAQLLFITLGILNSGLLHLQLP